MKPQTIQWMSREEIEQLAKEMNRESRGATASREANAEVSKPVASQPITPTPAQPIVPAIFDLGCL